LTGTERRYTVCEQELLAIIHALQNFRIYVSGRKIKIYTDNKALSFLQRYVLTSNSLSRWILEVQEYELEIGHIKGSQNHFADISSRNAAGLMKEQLNETTRPNELTVAPINLNVDQSIKRELKNIEEYQTPEPAIQSIKERIEIRDSTVSSIYIVKPRPRTPCGGHTFR
jgi:hypothetical protein